MVKYGVIGLALALILSAVGFAQDDAPGNNMLPGHDGTERILISDPEPVETEYFLSEGSAPSEIVTDSEMIDDQEMLTDAAALAALASEADGDMAAMPEVMDEAG